MFIDRTVSEIFFLGIKPKKKKKMQLCVRLIKISAASSPHNKLSNTRLKLHHFASGEKNQIFTVS